MGGQTKPSKNGMKKMKTHEIWGYSCKCACIYEHMYTYMYKCIRYHIHMRICILTAYALIQYAVALCSILLSYGQRITIALFPPRIHPHSMVPKKCGTSPLNHGDPGGCFSWGWDWSRIYSFMGSYMGGVVVVGRMESIL